MAHTNVFLYNKNFILCYHQEAHWHLSTSAGLIGNKAHTVERSGPSYMYIQALFRIEDLLLTYRPSLKVFFLWGKPAFKLEEKTEGLIQPLNKTLRTPTDIHCTSNFPKWPHVEGFEKRFNLVWNINFLFTVPSWIMLLWFPRYMCSKVLMKEYTINIIFFGLNNPHKSCLSWSTARCFYWIQWG